MDEGAATGDPDGSRGAFEEPYGDEDSARSDQEGRTDDSRGGTGV